VRSAVNESTAGNMAREPASSIAPFGTTPDAPGSFARKGSLSETTSRSTDSEFETSEAGSGRAPFRSASEAGEADCETIPNAALETVGLDEFGTESAAVLPVKTVSTLNAADSLPTICAERISRDGASFSLKKARHSGHLAQALESAPASSSSSRLHLGQVAT
jgi:hypothetical protein